MKWEKPNEAEDLKKVVDKRINKLKADIEKKANKIKEKGNKWKDKKIRSEQSKIKELSSQINLLNKSLDIIDKIESDERIFAFEKIEGGKHGVRKDGEIIYIQTSSHAFSIHEIMHIGQSFENGGLSFNKDNMLLNSGNSIRKKVNMEVDAYRAQYSMNRGSMPRSVNGLDNINSEYLEKIQTSSGELVYPFVKAYNNFIRQQNKIKKKK